MRASARSILIASVTVLLGACRKDDVPIKTTSSGEANASPSAAAVDSRGHSLVRVVNAVSGGGDVVVQVDTVTIFNGVKPASVTDYREISNTLASFRVHAPNVTDDASVAQSDQVLMDGNRYTVFLVAEDVTHNALRIVKDEIIPDSGKARIRVMHAAPGGPELDISMGDSRDKLFSAVSFGRDAPFHDVDPIATTLNVRARDESKVLLRIPGLNLKPGTSTTVVITGASKLAAFTFTDAPLTAAKGS